MAKYNNSKGKSRGDKYMISENMSDPSNMPRGNKSVEYAYVDCGGHMAMDSVKASDRDSDQMASKLNSQLNPGKF